MTTHHAGLDALDLTLRGQPPPVVRLIPWLACGRRRSPGADASFTDAMRWAADHLLQSRAPHGAGVQQWRT